MNQAPQKTAYWEDWQQAALAAGVPAALAQLGHDVLRNHRKNRWSKDFLGVEEDGEFMLQLCLEEPDAAEMMFLENLFPYDTALLDQARLRLKIA
ncbi:MAG: hypothetical protein ACRYGK_13335 [Janthinobacterium lividum]